MTPCQCWRSMHSHCYRRSHSFQCLPPSAKPDPPTLHKVHFLSGYFYLFFPPFLFTFCPKYNIMFFHCMAEKESCHICVAVLWKSNEQPSVSLCFARKMANGCSNSATCTNISWNLVFWQIAQLQQDWKSIFGIPKRCLNSLRHILVCK